MNTPGDLFAQALLDPVRPVPEGLGDGRAQAAGRRFDVYRNNIAVSLNEALRVGFPVITKLIGEQNMAVLGGAYFRAHPPSTPVMMLYGADFPGFLADTAQLAHLGYLPDIARLELAIRRAYHAGDADPVRPEHLARIPAQALLRVGFTFAPAVQVLRSDWPIHDIWQFATFDNAAKPQQVAQDVLITRPEFDPAPQLLPPGGAIWINALMAGQNIGDALDLALAEAPGFDMTAPLALLLQGGALSSLTDKG